MCSKKVAGVALFTAGLILVILGVVFGLLLPSAAQKKIEESVCVNSKDSPGYGRWEGPSLYRTRVYYWNITNKDEFFYRGEKPKLRQAGPYVYSITSKRVDVKFEDAKVTSKPFEKAEFNKKLTKEECPTCGEDDKLTVLNAGYLAQGKVLSQAIIPLMMNILFERLKRDRNETSILRQMGQADNQLNLTYPSNAFGSWIHSLQHFESLRKTYSLAEMNGLYGALLNTSKFGPFTNPPLLAKCLGGNLSVQCGLAINLNFQPKQPQAAKFIQEILCPNTKLACFNTSKNGTYKALRAFTLELSKAGLSFLTQHNFGATTTRNQSDLSIGYKLHLPGDPDGIPIPGSVTSHANETEARKKATSSTFHTCESTGDRFAFAAVGGESTVSINLYPNASKEQLKVRGYYNQFPGRKSLKACSTKYAPTENSYEIFITYFRFAIPVKYKEDFEIHGIPMHKYSLDEAAVEVNNVTVFTKGVFDVSRVLKGPFYASLPGFLYGEESLHVDLDHDKPTVDKHESLLSIEPISGTAMQLKLRIQLNGILSSDLSAPGSNMTFVDKLIPISWTEIEATIDADTAKEYSSQVFGGLRMSCGLLVSLPVIGGILVIVGVILIVLAVKKPGSVTVA
ncbi:uncharacterized protein LOC111338069 [Stylophora pistillata]|uniref:Platelet glycoprotein 4 n=1 Tax=Stylophora pistillata TaxID=50429 RepID=A0A2B4RT59_STYPI|nr:uncharacterized protein LOC111338069 [Stylophora pistillata]XP_022800211.1 uncharacterized protein LOC111338069 [Stylophora pistillata]XP_022800212.1 uncharacterized protein LOC111338069 [Stylophora pistillata]PFX19537.1 Platelet glycoprotein 4 [Stylophora pistillata]